LKISPIYTIVKFRKQRKTLMVKNLKKFSKKPVLYCMKKIHKKLLPKFSDLPNDG
jgi:hypothetical protein